MTKTIALNIKYRSPDEDDKNGDDTNPDGGDKGGGS